MSSRSSKYTRWPWGGCQDLPSRGWLLEEPLPTLCSCCWWRSLWAPQMTWISHTCTHAHVHTHSSHYWLGSHMCWHGCVSKPLRPLLPPHQPLPMLRHPSEFPAEASSSAQPSLLPPRLDFLCYEGCYWDNWQDVDGPWGFNGCHVSMIISWFWWLWLHKRMSLSEGINTKLPRWVNASGPDLLSVAQGKNFFCTITVTFLWDDFKTCKITQKRNVHDTLLSKNPKWITQYCPLW